MYECGLGWMDMPYQLHECLCALKGDGCIESAACGLNVAAGEQSLTELGGWIRRL
jgi:hypothetical protein